MFWILMSLAATALAILVLEMGLRVWLICFGGSYVWSPHRRMRFHHDLRVLSGADAVANFDINAMGERGAPPPHDWTGVYRVLVMGASAAECIALDQPHSWPEVLRRELTESGRLDQLGSRSVHVGNVGKSLLPTAAQIRALRAMKSRYRNLDLIIFMVGFSDLVAWLEEGGPAGRGPKPVDAHRIFDRSPSDLGWHWRRLALARVFSTFIHWVQRPVRIVDTYTKRIADRRLRRKNAKHMQREIPDSAGMLAQFEADFVLLLQLARTVAKRVILVRHPWLETGTSKTAQESTWIGSFAGSVDCKEPGDYVSSEVMCELMARVDEAAKRVAEQQSIEQIDVKSLLPSDLDHYIDDIHLGVKGAQIVGKSIADHLLRFPHPSMPGRN